jgi:MFS family permease
VEINKSITQTRGETKRSVFRWFVVSLMFVAILFNYADREIWVVLEPAFARTFGWYSGPLSNYSTSALAVGNVSLILFIWGLVYAIMNFPGGWITDKLGLRKAMTLMFGLWSTFTILTAVTFNFLSMVVVRAFMGAGEGPVWPINSKITKNWSNRFDESKTFTFAGVGQSFGPIVGLLLGAAIYAAIGWELTFVVFGVLGLILTVVWYVFMRDLPNENKFVNEEELAYIQEGKPKAANIETEKLSAASSWRITAKVVFGTQAGWGILLTYLAYGYMLYSFLYYLPPLMFADFAHTVSSSAIYSALIDLGLVVGFVTGGLVNDFLVKRYNKVTARRMGGVLPMVAALVMVGLSYFTGSAHELIPTAALLAAAAFFMQSTSGSYSLNAVDIAPSGTSATVYGVYNGLLNLVGAFSAIIEGYLFIHASPEIAFTSMIFFMAMFVGGYLALIRKNTWDKALDYGAKLLEDETGRSGSKTPVN